MGRGYTYKCTKCDYINTFYTGIGFFFLEEKQEIHDDILKGKYGEEIQKFLKGHSDAILSISREIYLCNQCNNLQEKYHIRVSTQFEHYEMKYMCDSCKKVEMKVLKDYMSENLGCPKCDGKLEVGGVLFWD